MTTGHAEPTHPAPAPPDPASGRPGRRGPLTVFRALPLRSRIALLVTVAVALAVAAVSAVAWVMARAQLNDQLNTSLRTNNAAAQATQTFNRLGGCVSGPQTQGQVINDLSASVQIVLPDGRRCWVDGKKALPSTDIDIEVARGERPETLYDTKTSDGASVRVYTQPVVVGTQAAALSVARPLADIDRPLNTLAWVLVLVSGIGVVGAGATGLWVARTGLRPVYELTGAVEHIARTEDLTVRIPDEGTDEIARLSRSFNQMTAALASSRERQAQLIADAGHELRTPLTSMRTNIELLARSEQTGRAIPPEDRRELLASVKAQMTELAELIKDLQELSRTDAAVPGPPTIVPLHEIAEQALTRARLRGPELLFETSVDPWWVRGEAPALERAVVNLLDNAVKFSPPGAAVEVSLKAGELVVRDHGPGIPEEELPYVFDRFWRSPTARALPGSGLGLSIVARTAERAGGTARLRPAADGGSGTEAVLRIPGAPTPPPADPSEAGIVPQE
ncbi:sensor histidine kinase [Streptomyces sp. BI20]|uniref:sensor histidine kinase n=1 Tax=Streptomyces sp. BI20 TaxID=3403460 RepID=UPI003C711AB0